MLDTDFKAGYKATLQQARWLQEVIQDGVGKDKYIVGLFGSTLINGEGTDVDLIVAACPDATVSAEQIAARIVGGWSDRLVLWVIDEYDDYVDVCINFITKDGIYVDLFVKGVKA